MSLFEWCVILSAAKNLRPKAEKMWHNARGLCPRPDASGFAALKMTCCSNQSKGDTTKTRIVA
jgi:hypothetical protein